MGDEIARVVFASGFAHFSSGTVVTQRRTNEVGQKCHGCRLPTPQNRNSGRACRRLAQFDLRFARERHSFTVVSLRCSALHEELLHQFEASMVYLGKRYIEVPYAEHGVHVRSQAGRSPSTARLPRLGARTNDVDTPGGFGLAFTRQHMPLAATSLRIRPSALPTV